MKYLCLLLLHIQLLSCRSSETTYNTRPETKQTELSKEVRKYIVYDEPMIAITQVKLLDGLGSPALENQTVLIRNGYFEEIGEVNDMKIPEGAKVIEGRGKTIIPGIVGVHNHLHMPGQPFMGSTASKLYLAAGVTTIHTCGAASPYEEVALAEQIEKGEAIGPDIITSGPYFTGPGGNPNMIIPRSQAHIRDTIQHWVEQGVRWFKVYRHTRPEDLQVIIDEAHQHNAKVTGHLCSITFEEAVSMGIDGIEHGLNSASDFRKNKSAGLCNGSRGYIDSLDIGSEEVRRLHQHMIERNVFLTSTLSIYESSIPMRALADERSLKAMSPGLQAQYQERRQQYENEEEGGALREARLKRIMAFEYQFFKRGGTLTAGVDAGRHNLPGYGDQRNYELLIEAGFRPEEAIMIMSSNGARVLEKADIGAVVPGKRADFVLLNGDLMADASAIKAVEYVFKEGYGYDPQLLVKEVEGKVGP
ncbi:imidazolonepropionase-like amidohydrolase [Catalinimonas alkaloidigena]|uniref:amidohydrolase family protein n=1 Tax=Catalinimonas alkaloidigena TaxID=1075417 RepID=UPI002406A7C0|nr:amidohydrolase family protein [Catalinimonas alkaloidigena]MDF9798696.1 imidazolonepropionase-like amidohydrolase [Catalinimonas alkaloidigena]